jgi:plastocyanin
LRPLIQAAGLTNNRALFVNSHGEALPQEGEHRYYFRPHEGLVPSGQSAPRFSVGDLARFVGAEAASQIHNVVLAGCNTEGAFNAGEFRKHFPFVTNVTYCPPGQHGYQPMFHQAVLVPSVRIKTFYESTRPGRAGTQRHFIRNRPTRNARQLIPYLAELFLPGADAPFCLQVAGRELLDPLPGLLTQARQP